MVILIYPQTLFAGGIKSLWILIFVIVDVQITAIVFFYFQVGWGGGGVVWDWLYLIISLQKTRQPPSCNVKFLQILCSSCIHLILVILLLSLVKLFKWDRENQILHKHYFPFFYHHKINLHLEYLFLFSCFLKYESFSSWQQSYFRNIGYFEGIYTCENLTFHLQTEKEVQFVSEMVCLHNASIPWK